MLALLLLMHFVTSAERDVVFNPRRKLDVELSAYASIPESFSLCASAHPGRPVEVNLCLGGGAHLLTAAPHVFYRARWLFPSAAKQERGWVLSFGPGVGVRGMRVCPFAVCGFTAGPEGLLSFEALYWFPQGFGVTAQADAGAAMLWTTAGSRVQRSLVWPARVSLGIAF